MDHDIVMEGAIDAHIDRLIEAEAKEQAQQRSNATGPQQLGPERMSGGQTTDDVLADLFRSPLFMTELAPEDVQDNVDLAALRALSYEGTPLENSLGFKERGNDCFLDKRFADAKNFYATAISLLLSEERKRARQQQQQQQQTKENEGDDSTPVDQDEIQREKQCLEALYVNRAACHLEMKNYRSCWTDCAAALRLNPNNLKAYYRSGKALLAVDRIQEADDACARGLGLNPENKSLKLLASSIIERAGRLDQKAHQEFERKAQKVRRANLLRTAIAARGIVMEKTQNPPDMEDARVRLVLDEDDPTSELVFPTMLLYPLRMESDFIKEFGETHALERHLSYILPPPWDEKQQYTPSNVVCYVETKDGGLLKMGKRVTLLKVLAGGKVVVFDQVMRIYVLPADKGVSWAQEFKAKRAAEKKVST